MHRLEPESLQERKHIGLSHLQVSQVPASCSKCWPQQHQQQQQQQQQRQQQWVLLLLLPVALGVAAPEPLQLEDSAALRWHQLICTSASLHSRTIGSSISSSSSSTSFSSRTSIRSSSSIHSNSRGSISSTASTSSTSTNSSSSSSPSSTSASSSSFSSSSSSSRSSSRSSSSSRRCAVRCGVVRRDGELVATVEGSCREFVDKALLGLRVYTYFVCAVNPQGQEGPSSDPCCARTSEPGKPSAPTNLACSHRAADRIEISWEPPADHGGAPVRFYRVYRDGAPIAFLPAVGPQAHKFTDTSVEEGQSYSYTVSAWHDLPPPDYQEAPSSSSSSSSSSSGLFRVQTPAAVEGLQSEPVSARAEQLLQGPRLDDGKGHIMLQGFNWLSSKNPLGWYNVLCSKLQDIKTLGVSIIWCPPPTECVGWEGYMPTRWYSLKSHYGSPGELQRLIREAAKAGLACCVDLVANHRCGTQQDRRGHWTIFEGPDWGPWAVVKNNLQGYHGEGGEDTGVSVDCAPDIDHTNPQVQKDMKLWTAWLLRDQAFVENLGRPFTVGEYWHGDTAALVNYVRAAGGSLAAFDFAFYYHLQRAVESGEFGILNACGNLNGLVGIEPKLAVTFIENHDTDHLDYCRTFCNGDLNGVLQGYAVILTHPGVPCIYWNHYSDYGDYSRTERGLYAAYISPRDRWCHPHNARVAMKIGWENWQPGGEGWRIATCGHNFCVWTR
ncbi:Alpha amylase, catalytic domain containing protein, putative [Eimeria tenella]|uniref:Alpha amylase, catalytic domain containing protein, putative n=1 Tax=Eimeria tenella TaxID=5802 RepID=U6KJH7_EIMTE|nr:Alpha amylase, catalytic domain containing protein, putative [Eimeria tenella]CDJ36946.1 Alpha amylase, catalytic domain containing protein, putative [Eimeria tenella]|eukprot:XP_013227784.1 Alpha amylase, catalytic domain containing protein, putative [Eimeria tenella]